VDLQLRGYALLIEPRGGSSVASREGSVCVRHRECVSVNTQHYYPLHLRSTLNLKSLRLASRAAGTRSDWLWGTRAYLQRINP